MTVNGEKKAVTEGQGWYDHEFGGLENPSADTVEGIETGNYAWTWAAIQFKDGRDLTAAVLLDNHVEGHGDACRRRRRRRIEDAV